MKIDGDLLITGASGFLGQFLVQGLSSDFSIITLGRKDSDINIDLSKGVPMIPSSLACVIHASGKAHMIPKSEDEKQAFFDVNLQGTANLLQGIKDSGSKLSCFIFMSTVAVYGKDNGELISENSPLQGGTPYADSKMAAEKLLIEWCSENNVTLTILRLPLIIGKNAPGNLGAMVRMMKKGLYLGIGKGSAKKSVVFADDIAPFIRSVKDIGGIYNLTDGYHPSVKELEDSISRQIGRTKLLRLPDYIIKGMASLGDIVGRRAPINSLKYRKLTSSLTFDDSAARRVGWVSRVVIEQSFV